MAQVVNTCHMTVITLHLRQRITLRSSETMYWHLHFEHCKDLTCAWKIGSCFIFSEWQKLANKPTKREECFWKSFLRKMYLVHEGAYGQQVGSWSEGSEVTFWARAALILSYSFEAEPSRSAVKRPAISHLVPRGLAELSVVAAASLRGLRYVFIVSRLESEIRNAVKRGWYPPQPGSSILPSLARGYPLEAPPTSRSPVCFCPLVARRTETRPQIWKLLPGAEEKSTERDRGAPTRLSGSSAHSQRSMRAPGRHCLNLKRAITQCWSRAGLAG